MQIPASAIRAAEAQPRCDPPRTTFGLPMTTKSPAARAAAPTSSAIGNSQIRAPRARNRVADGDACRRRGSPSAGRPRARPRRSGPARAGPSSARAAIRSAIARNSVIFMPARPLYLAPSTGSLQFLQDRRRVVVERQQMHPPGGDVAPARSPARRGCTPPSADAPACRRSSDPASSASSSARQAVRLRSPGSHDSVTPWNAVVMPLASNCASVSRSARSTGKSTPGRGWICRSNASPCMSTMPGSTSSPDASSVARRRRRSPVRSARPAAPDRPCCRPSGRAAPFRR